MGKAKKYFYPLAFSIASFISFILLAIVILAFFNTDYAGLGIAFIVLLIWAWLVVPIYCIKYSKIIREEKFKFLFATYNSVIVTLFCMLPLINETETYIYGVALFFWMEIWCSLPLIINVISRAKQASATAEEFSHTNTSLLQGKTKRVIAICCVLFHMIILIFSSEFMEFLILQNLMYFFPLITASLTLVFCVLKNEMLWWKKWLLPVAFGANLIYNLILLIQSFQFFGHAVNIYDSYLLEIIQLLCSCLILVAIACMLFGTLFNFKYKIFLRYGSLGCTVLWLIRVVIFAVEMPLLDMGELLRLPAYVLFYSGIFVITISKKVLNVRDKSVVS